MAPKIKPSKFVPTFPRYDEVSAAMDKVGAVCRRFSCCAMLLRLNSAKTVTELFDIAMLVNLLSKAATVAMLCFVVSSMLATGAGLTVARIIEPLRNVRLVFLALLANFVLMPAGALALAKVLRLDEPFSVGLLLLGCAAGAPFLPKLAELAKGNLAFAVGVMVLLMVVTVAYMPIVLPLALPGVTVNPWQLDRVTENRDGVPLTEIGLMQVAGNEGVTIGNPLPSGDFLCDGDDARPIQRGDANLGRMLRQRDAVSAVEGME